MRIGWGVSGETAGVANAPAPRSSATAATAPNAGAVPVKEATAPSTGPNIAPAIAAPKADPISRPRRPAGAAATSHASAPVHEKALDTPWRKRARSSAQTESAKPNATVVAARRERPTSTVGFDPDPRRQHAAGDSRQERTGGVHGLQHSGTGLAQVKFVNVVGEQRRQRREEHRVHEDDRPDQDEQPAHDVELLAPAGLAAIEKGAQPFLPFRAGAEACGDLRRHVTVRAFADEALRLADRFGAGAEQFGHDLVHGVVQRCGDLADQSDAQGRVGVEALAGEEVAACVRADLRQDEG